MKLGRQEDQRIRLWIDILKKQTMESLMPLKVWGFECDNTWTYEAAVSRFDKIESHSGQVQDDKGLRRWEPLERWGEAWKYGWFYAQIEVDEGLEDLWLTLHLGMGEEMLVWVNGEVAGAIDKQHKFITLTRKAVLGQKYDIVAEVYAGHGHRLENPVPKPYDQEVFEDPKGPLSTIHASEIHSWDEAFFQLSMDMQVLYQIMLEEPEASLRAMKIGEGLIEATKIWDPEDDLAIRRQKAIAARKYLAPLMEDRGGDSVPIMHTIGQSHLDLAWLWTLEETRRKSARTYANQLGLMEIYDDYQFFLCEPPIIDYLGDYYPKVYDRVLEKVEKGQIIPEGSMWVESDCNLIGGESLVRQFLYGKKWFKGVMNTDTQIAWLPDTFGFTGALPQIMASCGVPYFATQKLLRVDPEAQVFPHNHFWWEGMDGTRVFGHIFKKNNANLEAKTLIERWRDDRHQKRHIDGMLFPFGYGDGGGGATREMMEVHRRCVNLEGVPKCQMGNPAHFFLEAVEKSGVLWKEQQGGYDKDLNGYYATHVGELYLAWHRGTYTSQAATKKWVRKAEYALRDLDFVASMIVLEGHKVSGNHRNTLEGLWKELLLNTFHDILPGTSIGPVHDTAVKSLKNVVEGADQLKRTLLLEFLGGEPFGSVLVNSFPFERSIEDLCIEPMSMVVLRHSSEKKDTIDPPLKAKFSEKFHQYWVRSNRIGVEEGGSKITLCKEGYLLENQYLIARINPSGQLISLIHRGSGMESVGKLSNVFTLNKDLPGVYDAWELERISMGLQADEIPIYKTSIIDRGGVMGLKLEIDWSHSRIDQEIILGPYDRSLRFNTRVDWRERHKLLKVHFSGPGLIREALCDVQFGHQRRETHKGSLAQADRYEVWHHKYVILGEAGQGLALMNDGKYGISLEDDTVGLSLLKAATVPDKKADQGVHEFTYGVMPYVDGDMGAVVRESYDLNNPLPNKSVGSHEVYVIGGELTGLSPNIQVENMKLAEDESAGLVLRLFECEGKTTSTILHMPGGVKACYEANMLEQCHGTDLMKLVDGKHHIELDFRAFEIKTLVLQV